MGATFYQLIILLTTCNFPNIMLPAYNDKRIYSLYFVFFLIIGLFFLMNVLLAVVYENYKKRIETKAELKTNKRVGYISTIF